VFNCAIPVELVNLYVSQKPQGEGCASSTLNLDSFSVICLLGRSLKFQARLQLLI
jgi:hypothetical protein